MRTESAHPEEAICSYSFACSATATTIVRKNHETVYKELFLPVLSKVSTVVFGASHQAHDANDPQDP